jgi:hypothetical protein
MIETRIDKKSKIKDKISNVVINKPLKNFEKFFYKLP